MSPILIAQLIEALAKVVTEGMSIYADGKAVMAASDLAAVHVALLKAEAATASLRPQVDAALDAAAKH